MSYLFDSRAEFDTSGIAVSECADVTPDELVALGLVP